MKYQYLTINTGHVSRHDTDVDYDASLTPRIQAMLDDRAGPIPGVSRGLPYQFADSGGSAAVLSVMAGVGVYVWTAGFYLHADKAYADGMIELARHAVFVPGAIPPTLHPPGLALVILAGAALAKPEDIYVLADFAKTMFACWALGRAGR